ncbi:hypothetical protein Tco_0251811 [Tanacetum coccineum]
MDDIVSSDEEWEESDFGNLPNTTIVSFFKPYLEAQEKMTLKRGMNAAQRRVKATLVNWKVSFGTKYDWEEICTLQMGM